jgi:plasmid maintenance system antidote protein VapI
LLQGEQVVSIDHGTRVLESEVATDLVKTALDRAAEILGNDSKVAEHLQTDRHNLSKVRQKRRALTIDQVARLATLTDIDGIRLLAANELDRVRDREQREKLRHMLFTVALVGVVAMCSIFEIPALAYETVNIAPNRDIDGIYIVALILMVLEQLRKHRTAPAARRA